MESGCTLVVTRAHVFYYFKAVPTPQTDSTAGPIAGTVKQEISTADNTEAAPAVNNSTAAAADGDVTVDKHLADDDMDIDNDDDGTTAQQVPSSAVISQTVPEGDSAVRSSATAESGDVVDSVSKQSAEVIVGASHDDTIAIAQPQVTPPVVGSVSDLKVMARDELPSEDALTAGIQALIAKTQESSAMLDQVIRQKKVLPKFVMEFFVVILQFSKIDYPVKVMSP